MVAYRRQTARPWIPTDYTAANGTLTFSAGNLHQTILVPTRLDSDVEQDETFTVMLSSPTDEATIQRSVATGTITDDDLPTLFTVRD